jgi:hypothetical protein
VNEWEYDLRGQACEKERGPWRFTPGQSRELLCELGQEERLIQDLLVQYVPEDLSDDPAESGEYSEPDQRVGKRDRLAL